MNRSAPLSSFRVRPRFSETVSLSRDETRRAILGSLAREPADTFQVRSFDEFIGVHMADPQRNTWSPRLMLSLYDWPEGGTLIEGTFGPEAEVWSIFVYGYLGTGLIGTFAAIYGGAQLFIGQTPSAFFVTGTMVALATAFYVAAQLGQKFAAHQTILLHEAYERALVPHRSARRE